MPTAPSLRERSENKLLDGITKTARLKSHLEPGSFNSLSGFRMPAEWELHESTWLAWPVNKTTWPGRLLKEVESVYTRMIQAILPGEKVNLLVPDPGTGRRVLRALGSRRTALQNLAFHHVRTVDAWIRDYGPIFVTRKNPADSRQPTAGKGSKYLGRRRVAFTKWQFNAWGAKYGDLAMDNGVVDRIRSLRSVRRFDMPMVLEGGSIDLNGIGACLTTEQCLLNPNRNPGLSRGGIEKYLKRALGVRKIVWLKEGIEGDDTDGHVDDIARFVGPRTVLAAVESEAADKNGRILKENLRILRSERDQGGKPLKVIELPMPGKVGIRREGGLFERLPASYANFYIANKTVLVPLYSHRNDKAAMKTVRKAFPDRKAVGIECSALVAGLGSIHCVTQQEPR